MHKTLLIQTWYLKLKSVPLTIRKPKLEITLAVPLTIRKLKLEITLSVPLTIRKLKLEIYMCKKAKL